MVKHSKDFSFICIKAMTKGFLITFAFSKSILHFPVLWVLIWWKLHQRIRRKCCISTTWQLLFMVQHSKNIAFTFSKVNWHSPVLRVLLWFKLHHRIRKKWCITRTRQSFAWSDFKVLEKVCYSHTHFLSLYEIFVSYGFCFGSNSITEYKRSVVSPGPGSLLYASML